MKKVVSIILCMCLSGALTCLSAKSGIEAGYLNSAYRFKAGNETENSDALSGFYVAATRNIKLLGGLSLQPGLSYSYLTKNDKEDLAGFTMNLSQTEHYIGIPLRLQYRIEILPVLNVFAYTGPSFNFGLVGKNKADISSSILGQNINGSYSYDYFSNKLKSDNISDEVLAEINKNMSESQYNRFDIQYGIGAGVGLFKFLEVRGGYDWGLLNRLKNNDNKDNSIKRNQFYIALSVRF